MKEREPLYTEFVFCILAVQNNYSCTDKYVHECMRVCDKFGISLVRGLSITVTKYFLKRWQQKAQSPLFYKMLLAT